MNPQQIINRSQGIELWNEAKELIPGGNQLLSKKSEMFAPDQWPAYYKKAKGVEVWGLDDQHYYDMSIMGMGTCTLGYANDEVDNAVKKAIDQGNMCTLNAPEEVELAKRLVELHPWADMVRFARAGGEACAVAVRIARVFSGKEKVAFCGYHGWHDWYLSSNVTNAKISGGKVLSDSAPLGIPSSLKNTALPFRYGKTEDLESLVAENKDQVGVIIMEVVRRDPINLEFLQSVKKIAKKIGAVLIYDEVTTGYRHRAGGIHVDYNLEPDML